MSNIYSNSDDAKPCVKCGASDRNHRGGCSPCTKTSSAAYRAANKDKIKAKDAAYRSENVAKIKESSATYRAKNVDPIRESSAIYRAKNTEKQKTKSAEYYRKNSNRIAIRSAANSLEKSRKNAEYYLANAEKLRLTNSLWSKNNPGSARVRKQNHRARKNAFGGKLSNGLSDKLFKLQKGKCPCCQQPLGDDYHLDHKMPLALGGPNTDDNMQLLKARCNSQKQAKHPIDFMQSRGFLL